MEDELDREIRSLTTQELWAILELKSSCHNCRSKDVVVKGCVNALVTGTIIFSKTQVGSEITRIIDGGQATWLNHVWAHVGYSSPLHVYCQKCNTPVLEYDVQLISGEDAVN